MGDPSILSAYHCHNQFAGAAVSQPEQPRLLVSEIFGPTIQGEGLSLGIPAMFLRLAGCPLACSWCDTAYAWDWQRFDKRMHSRRVTGAQAWQEVLRLAADSAVATLVITGGEPASQALGLVGVARSAAQAGWRVELETSGAVDPGPLLSLLDLVTVSPKLSSSRMEEPRRIRIPVLEALAKRDDTIFKFVIDDAADLNEADALVARLGMSPARVMVMAQADRAEQVVERTRWLVAAAIERGYRVTPRLHTILWDNERGR